MERIPTMHSIVFLAPSSGLTPDPRTVFSDSVSCFGNPTYKLLAQFPEESCSVLAGRGYASRIFCGFCVSPHHTGRTNPRVTPRYGWLEVPTHCRDDDHHCGRLRSASSDLPILGQVEGKLKHVGSSSKAVAMKIDETVDRLLIICEGML